MIDYTVYKLTCLYIDKGKEYAEKEGIEELIEVAVSKSEDNTRKYYRPALSQGKKMTADYLSEKQFLKYGSMFCRKEII